MEYRNRGERCRHGLMKGVIHCPTCDPPKKYYDKHYIPSSGGHIVTNNKGKKAVREARPSEYIVGRARRSEG